MTTGGSAGVESVRPGGPGTELTPFHRGATLVLFFTSGFAGLVYEVLWMKELGLLFGNTAHAAATTLAAFFLGLMVGAGYWGRKAKDVKRPLRVYAYLEGGVALSALLYFLVLDTYHAVYGPLFQVFGERHLPFLAVKFLLAVGVLFPPSFFMGGTLPIMSQHLIRRVDSLGRMGSALYGLNTLGAAFGAFVGGFYLPRYLGFDNAYFVAIVTTMLVAMLAWLLGREERPRESAPKGRSNAVSSIQGGIALLSPGAIRALAFFSGLATLSLEVLWTRMFAQVLQNSVYTFSTILVTFLLALALGAGLANRLIRRRYEPTTSLLLLLVGSALLVGTTPFAFYRLTNGLEYFGGQWGFSGYVMGLFACAMLVMLLPGVLLGSIFPYLLRLAEPLTKSAGRTVGDLAAINTLGAVTGSLLAGFVLLNLLGLWASIRLVATGYACAALLLLGVVTRGKRAKLLRLLPVAALLLLVSFLDASRLPVVRVDPIEKGESVLQTWEGSAGFVSVIRQPNSLTLKLDNDYSLGGTGAAKYEEGQAHLPLWLHPRPRSVFFLGMGTGITAGAALLHPVEQVVVCELAPNVVEAARRFFRPYLHGLFDDPRVTVVAEDGRNYLSGTSQRFDLVIADLFMTWKAGVGSLYSREHYEAARHRLRKGGLYVQWLPLYQVSVEEFGVIARTMREVFPLVTLWRGAITPGWETAAIVGHKEASPLERQAVLRRLEESGEIELPGSPSGNAGAAEALQRFALRDLVLQYCGNLTAAGDLLAPFAVNTDDRPIIEYEAPITHRGTRANELSWFVGAELIGFLGQLQAAVPPERDPYLESLSPAEAQVARAGLSLYRSQVFDRAGDGEAAWQAMQEFQRLYSPAGSGETESELEQSRRELTELIESYEGRVQALREHLREVEGGAGQSPGEGN